MGKRNNYNVCIIQAFVLLTFIISLFSCSKTLIQEEKRTPDGNLEYKSTKLNDKVLSELDRVFQKRTIEGTGIFNSDNEGLARRTSINLAVAELAAQVQTLVRTESVIYNNKDIRDVVENRVHALVSNYKIDSAGYDPNSHNYRVRVSISGEDLVREVKRVLVK